MSTLFLYIFEPGKAPRTAHAQVGQKIGRSRDSNIPIEDPKVGRLHLEIVQMGDLVGVTDLNSKNGTRINGNEIPRNTPTPLMDGMELGIGDSTIRIDLSGAGAGSAPPPRDPSATMSAGGDSLSDSGTMHVPRPSAKPAPAAEGQGEGTQLVGRPAAAKPPAPEDGGGNTMKVSRPRGGATEPPAPADGGGNTMKVSRPRAGGSQPPAATPPPADGGGNTMKVSRPRGGGSQPPEATPPPADAGGNTMKVSRPRGGAGTPAENAGDGGGNTMKVSRPRGGGAAEPPAPADAGGNTMKVSRPRPGGGGAAPPAPAAPQPAAPQPAAPQPAAPQPAAPQPAAPEPAPPAAAPAPEQPAAAAPEAETSVAPPSGPAVAVGNHHPTLILVNPNLQTTKGIQTCPYSIGRQEGQSWEIRDDRISRDHAVLGFDGNDFTIMDCQSSSGTVVSGNRLPAQQASRLNDGDHIALGPLDFYFFLDTPEKRAQRATRHRAAVQHLVKNKKLSKAAAGRILGRAKGGERDAAELTLQEGEVSVKDWVEAVAVAKAGPNLVVLLGALVVLAGAAFGVLKWQGII